MSAFIDEHRDVLRGRADLPRVADRPVDVLRRQARAQAEPAARTLRDRELLAEIRRVYDGLAAGSTARGRCGGSSGRGHRGGALHGRAADAPGTAWRASCAARRAARPCPTSAPIARPTWSIATSPRPPQPLVGRGLHLRRDVVGRGLCRVRHRRLHAPDRRLEGRHHMRTSLVLDTLEMALWSRDRPGCPSSAGLVHHHDNGSQYTSFAFTQRLIDAGVDASVGSVGDALRQRPRRDRRSASTRPRRSAAKDPGRRSQTSNSRRWNGSTGSTPRACILPAADSRQRSTRQSIYIIKFYKLNRIGLHETRGSSAAAGPGAGQGAVRGAVEDPDPASPSSSKAT